MPIVKKLCAGGVLVLSLREAIVGGGIWGGGETDNKMGNTNC